MVVVCVCVGGGCQGPHSTQKLCYQGNDLPGNRA